MGEAVAQQSWRDIHIHARDGIRLYGRHYAAPGSSKRLHQRKFFHFFVSEHNVGVAEVKGNQSIDINLNVPEISLKSSLKRP